MIVNSLNFLNSAFTPPPIDKNTKYNKFNYLKSMGCDTVSFSSNKKIIVNNSISNIDNNTKERVEDELLKSAEIEGITKGHKYDKIANIIYRTLEEEELGSGSEGVTHIIPHTNLVLKTMERSERDNISFDELDKLDEHNNVVYKVFDFLIMDRIFGLDRAHVAKTNTIRHYSDIAASMPQVAFDDLFKNMCQIHIDGFFYDSKGHNIIIDTENDRFRPFDIYPNQKYAEYSRFDEPNEFTSYTLNPVECMVKTAEMSIYTNYYDNFLIKTMKSIANDFEYFTMFNFANSEDYLSDDTRTVFDKLVSLHKAKIGMLNEGFSKEEIKEMLSPLLDDFNELADNCPALIEDYPYEVRNIIKDIIEKRYQYQKIDESIKGENEIHLTGDYEKDKENFMKLSMTKAKLKAIADETTELINKVRDEYGYSLII